MPARKKPARPSVPGPVPEPPAPEASKPSVPETPEQAIAVMAEVKDVRELSTTVIAEMVRLLPPSVVAQEVKDLLRATRWVGKGENAREVPDYRAREIGLRYYFSYGIGLPVQRIEQINTTVESESQLVERMRYSPATLRHMEALIEQIKAEQAAGAP